MRESGRIVAKVHEAMRASVRPAISTWDLDQIAFEVLREHGAESAFLGYRGFPAHICTSLNKELVHGIPSREVVLREGDVISIDVGTKYRGFIGDSAWTYVVGTADESTSHLLNVTEQSLYAGIEQSVVGNRVRDISRAVQIHVEANELQVVRGYTGHGVGRRMHEPPQVLNYVSGDADGNIALQAGMVLAIEPMVQQETWQTRVLADEWTVVNKSGALAAHFEHTVAVTDQGPEILTLP